MRSCFSVESLAAAEVKDSLSHVHASGVCLSCRLLGLLVCSSVFAKPIAALGTASKDNTGSLEMASEADIPQQGEIYTFLFFLKKKKKNTL